MNALPFSLGSCSTPVIHTLTSTTRLVHNQHLRNAESSTVKVSRNDNPASSFTKELIISPSTCSRREAIGIGLCFSFFECILQPKPTAAAEATPCEFTQTPSGLEFCDKVVGYGPQAEQGQLIKVIQD